MFSSILWFLLATVWIIALSVLWRPGTLSLGDRCEVLKKFYCRMHGIWDMTYADSHDKDDPCNCNCQAKRITE
jgi:hypothetical protein